MATTTEHQSNGSSATQDTIVVENPATGEVITTLPASTPEQLEEMAAKARRAQPEWLALGFSGRAKVLRRMQKWVLDNADRFLDTLVSETGKTREDAALAELGYAANSFGFWAKNAAKYLSDEKVKTVEPVAARTQGDRSLRAGRARRRDRAVELPVHEHDRRRDPGAGRRQLGHRQALERDPADFAADRGRAPRVRDPR